MLKALSLAAFGAFVLLAAPSQAAPVSGAVTAGPTTQGIVSHVRCCRCWWRWHRRHCHCWC